MLFSSITFIYYFLTITVIIYFIVPPKAKNIVLLLSSLFFYFAGEPIYVFLMIAAALSGYAHGLLIEKYRGRKGAKSALISSIVIGVGLLGFFKYSNFFINNMNNIFGTEIGALSLALPIGISFYTFQILSYTIDLYRGEAVVQHNFFDFATYVSLFPQLIAGPIVRYSTVQEELKGRKHSLDDIAYVVGRFAIGLGKKVLLSNTLAELGAIISGLQEKTVLSYWMGAVAFTLQIYFDFSGYSDMAIGLGRVFGFHFLENFNYPYISKSITEFWRRWHISLGTWFRDYVYIPLGGNRVKKWRLILNILVVWMLTGFWHGAEWNFILWGLYFGIILIVEKFFLLPLFSKIPKIPGNIIGHIYTLFLTVIGFVIFNSANVSEAGITLSAMFGAQGIDIYNDEALYYLTSYSATLCISALLATPIAKKLVSLISAKEAGDITLSLLKPIYYIIILLVCTASLINGSFNPFIYFRF
ncbi:MAG: MBOAT family protein [Clostridia bacterium]|nr:MBOAT family protein [Clostridia bacterium]